MSCKLTRDDVSKLVGLFHVHHTTIDLNRHENMCQAFQDVLNLARRGALRNNGANCFGGWYVDQVIRSGTSGTVLSAFNRKSGARSAFKIIVSDRISKSNSGDSSNLKISKSPKTPEEEIAIQGAFARIDLAPGISCHEILSNRHADIHVIGMHALPPPDLTGHTGPNVLGRMLLLLETMREKGYTHGDLHPKNMFLRHDLEHRFVFALLDFSWASTDIYFPQLDVARLLTHENDLSRPVRDMYAEHLNIFLREPKTVERAVKLPRELDLYITGDIGQMENLSDYYTDLIYQSKHGRMPENPQYKGKYEAMHMDEPLDVTRHMTDQDEEAYNMLPYLPDTREYDY